MDEAARRAVNARPMRRAGNQQLIHDLSRGLRDRLTAAQSADADAYLAAHEWGLALEMLADHLSEDGSPVTRDERGVFPAARGRDGRHGTSRPRAPALP